MSRATCALWTAIASGFVTTLSPQAGAIAPQSQTPAVTPDQGFDYLDQYEEEFEEPPPLSEQIDELARDRRYSFCHDDVTQLHPIEYQLCPLARDIETRCPAYASSCERQCDPNLEDCDFAAWPLEPIEPKRSFELTLPQIPGLRYVFWAVFGAVCIALIVWIVRNLLDRRKSQSPTPSNDTRPTAAFEPSGSSGMLEGDALALLLRAQRAAQRGDFSRGLSDLHAALLFYLDQRGLVRIEPDRTNGDYYHELHGSPEFREPFREVSREVERVKFGGYPTDAGTFERFFARFEPWIKQGLVLLVLVAGGLFNAGCDFTPMNPQRYGSAGDRSAVGLSLFRDLLERRGATVRRRVQSVKELDDSIDTLIIYEHFDFDDEDWEKIIDWVHSGHNLLYAAPSPAEALGIVQNDVECSSELKAAGSDAQLRLRPARLELRDEDWTPLAYCGGELYAATREQGAGQVTILANADLLRNASLMLDAHAQFLMDQLQWPGHVDLVDYFTGAGAETPYEAVRNSNLSPFVVQLLLLMLVFYLWRGTAFGKLRDLRIARRHAFSEHVRALGDAYARAKASRLALAHYASWAIEQLRARVSPAARPRLHDLASAIAERIGKPEHEVMAVLAEAASAREELTQGPSGVAASLAPAGAPETLAKGDTGGLNEDLQLIRELQSWLTLTGGTR